MKLTKAVAVLAGCMLVCMPVYADTWGQWGRSLLNLQGASAYDASRGEIGALVTQETAAPPVIPWLCDQGDWLTASFGVGAFQTRRAYVGGAKIKVVPLLDKIAPVSPATIILDSRFIRLDLSVFVGASFNHTGMVYGLGVDILRKDFLK